MGAGGIGALLQNTLEFRRWDAAGMTVLVIIIGTILVDQASGWLRRRIIEGSDGTPGAEDEEGALIEGSNMAALAKADSSGQV